MHRRTFLRTLAPGAAATAAAWAQATERVTPRLTVVRGAVNGALIEASGKRLAIYGDPRLKPASGVEQVLFTHGRRDVVWAGAALVEAGALARMPVKESEPMWNPAKFWSDFQKKRFHDYEGIATRVPVAPLRSGESLKGGEKIEWNGLTIEAMDTPGYTAGAVSYLLELDGKRIAFTGDLIYGEGRIFDLYSMQTAVPEAKTRGYHGYAARAALLMESLRKVLDWRPDLLVPVRGPVIRNPRASVERLLSLLHAQFFEHFRTDALRWYWGDDNLRVRASRLVEQKDIPWMAMSEQSKLPGWIVAIGNSRLVISSSGGAMLVDCGYRRVIEEVKKLRDAGRFQKLEAIYVTHYHDDHTDIVQAAADEFGCPVYYCEQIGDVLERPQAYRLPALTHSPIRRSLPMKEGESRRWREFQLTFSYFPGQTLYHGGLLLEREPGEQIFLIGDSFTPSGIDDYCLLNRNLLKENEGYLYCLSVLKKMKPGSYWLINQHVEPMFRFTAEEIDFMAGSLRERNGTLQKLLVWDDPNYGVDEQWARFYPYGSEWGAGQKVELKVRLRNHSAKEHAFTVTPHPPEGWTASRPAPVKIAAGTEGEAIVSLTPARGFTGLAVITADVRFAEWDLREWVEALVTVR